MPLLAKLLPSRDINDHVHEPSIQEHSDSVRDEKDSGYGDFGEFDGDECLDSDMEGSILHRPRPKKPARAPALPQRSEKRASRILDNVMLELKSLNGSAPKDLDKASAAEETDPHELYLSSEEDASLSDDYDDSLLGFEPIDSNEADEEGTRESSSRSSSRKSQEVTARVVSLSFVGKPQIVEIFTHSTNPFPATPVRHSLDLGALTSTTAASSLSKPTSRRPSPLKLYPNSIRRMSISSIASLTHSSSSSSIPSNQSLTHLPPRKSSRLANLTSLVIGTKQSTQNATSHSFLNSDPFPTQPSQEHISPEIEMPTTPRTPTGMAAAAFKKSFTRGLNKARKPSMPKISLAYTAGVVTPRNDSKASLPIVEKEARESVDKLEKVESVEEEKDDIKPVKRSVTMPLTSTQTSQPSTPDGGPLRYKDIMKNVIRVPPPQSQNPKAKSSSMLGLGRRKSMKSK